LTKRLAAITGNWLLLATMCCVLTACGLFSTKSKHTALAQTGNWEGRLNLKTLTKPPEQFSANFTLQGTAALGELTIYTPIGTTLAVASWNADGAVLEEGSQKQKFASMETLTKHVTGASLPLTSLMSWLNSDGENIPGWEIRSENQPGGRRLFAKRVSPMPQLQLTLILDPP
jgi:outer membrane lipoprotein LolB